MSWGGGWEWGGRGGREEGWKEGRKKTGRKADRRKEVQNTHNADSEMGNVLVQCMYMYMYVRCNLEIYTI